MDGAGYVHQRCPKHPAADANGYVLQHRLVAEKLLGRFLTDQEEVHHADRIRSNNLPGNLRVFPNRAEHMKQHRSKRADPAVIERVLKAAADPQVAMTSVQGVSRGTIRKILRDFGQTWLDPNRIHLTIEQVEEALAQTRSLKAASTLLGCGQSTLQRNFPELYEKHRQRNTPGFLDEHREAVCQSTIDQGATKTFRKFGTSLTTLLAALRRWRAAGDLPTELVPYLDGLDRKRERTRAAAAGKHD